MMHDDALRKRLEILKDARAKLVKISEKLVNGEMSPKEALEAIHHDLNLRAIFVDKYAEIVRDRIIHIYLPGVVDSYGWICLKDRVIDVIVGVISAIEVEVEILSNL